MSSALNFTLAGQHGRSLGATPVALGDMGIASLSVVYQSAETDTASWFQPRRPGCPVPEKEQALTLFDAAGRRLLCGTLTTREYRYEPGADGWDMTLSGPLADMDRTLLRAATPGAPAALTFPRQPVHITLRQIIEAAAALGVPIRPGTISEGITIGRVTFRRRSCLEALVEMLRWLFDAQTRVDYDVPGLPTLSIIRRADAPHLTLPIGPGGVETVRLRPVVEARVDGVELHSVSRGSAGELTREIQSAGASTGRTQVAVISGPEAAGWPVEATLQGETIRTAARGIATLAALDPQLASIEAQHPGFLAALAIGSDGYALYNASDTFYGVNPITYTRVTDGLPAAAGVDQIMLAGSPREWFLRAGISHELQRITGTVGYKRRSGSEYEPAWWAAFSGIASAFGVTNYGTPPPYSTSFLFYELDVSCDAISAAYDPAATVYAPEVFEWLAPPPGLAEALLDAARVLPWAGSVTARSRDLGDWLGRRINITGGDPELAHAAALPSRVQASYPAALVQVTCGAAARLDLGSLVSRFRALASDATA